MKRKVICVFLLAFVLALSVVISWNAWMADDQHVDTAPVSSLPAPVPPTPDRRLPVGGRPGYTFVVRADGSTVLESPDGTRVPILGSVPKVPVLPKQTKASDAADRPLGQLIVTDEGVIEVPVDAVVTFIGKNHVVTTAPLGSVVYYVGGRVEHREARTAKGAVNYGNSSTVGK